MKLDLNKTNNPLKRLRLKTSRLSSSIVDKMHIDVYIKENELRLTSEDKKFLETNLAEIVKNWDKTNATNKTDREKIINAVLGKGTKISAPEWDRAKILKEYHAIEKKQLAEQENSINKQLSRQRYTRFPRVQ